jgi:hypothetical protein
MANQERSPLIDGFLSYTPYEELATRRESFERWMEIGGVLGRGFPRPILSVALTLGTHQHLGHEGLLAIALFKHRLHRTVFYPADLGRYLEALRTNGIDLVTRKEARVAPFTRVINETSTSGPYKGRAFVRWSDTRLDEEAGRDAAGD